MISKITKILATAGMLAVFSFANNSNATEGMTGGIMVGVGGDIGFYSNENTDLIYSPDGGTTDISTFNSKIDTSYGGYVTVGYMMDCLEGAIEAGYRQFKEKDSKNSVSKLESKQWFGMLRGTYYLDLQSSIYPYVMAGVGLVRSKINATLVKDASPIDATQYANIDDLKITKFGYEAGIGVATMFQSAMIGLGYKFFGVANIEDGDDYSDATFTGFDQAAVDNANAVKFGEIAQKIHTVEAFVKVTF
jgi:opacity protein-like surface antigen